MWLTSETPRISVVLPCRNAAAFLHPCIASLTKQTLAAHEILAVDDASTDATPAILAEWAARAVRVRVLRTSGGLVAALNAGIDAAACELVARMDADDVAHPDRLMLQAQAFRAEPELIACGTGVRYFPREHVRDGALRYQQWINSLHEPASIARDMFIECPIAHPTLMVRMDSLRAIGGYVDRGWPEDYDLLLRLYARDARMRNVPRVLLDWRERPDRLSRTDPRYAENAFRRCKVHYLIETRLIRSNVIVWGAGPVGKAFARDFAARDVRVRAFVELDPRKIGQTIHGAPVIPPSRLLDVREDTFVVAAVAGSQPRAEIRAALAGYGLQEGTDFIAVA